MEALAEQSVAVAPLRFAVGSANAAKVRAVEMVVTRIFPSRIVEVRGFNVPSSVAAQPMSAAETMQGADNRARAALSAAGSDFEFGIGLEVRHASTCTTCAVCDESKCNALLAETAFDLFLLRPLTGWTGANWNEVVRVRLDVRGRQAGQGWCGILCSLPCR